MVLSLLPLDDVDKYLLGDYPPKMAPQSIYNRLNKRLNGQLPAYLASRLERQRSYQDIAYDILLDYGERVTAETVRLWCRTKLPV